MTQTDIYAVTRPFNGEGTKRIVSEEALYRRINRRLRPVQECLCRSRGMRMFLEVGRYYVLDFNRNLVVDKHVSLAALGKELGCLAADEVVVERG